MSEKSQEKAEKAKTREELEKKIKTALEGPNLPRRRTWIPQEQARLPEVTPELKPSHSGRTEWPPPSQANRKIAGWPPKMEPVLRAALTGNQWPPKEQAQLKDNIRVRSVSSKKEESQ